MKMRSSFWRLLALCDCSLIFSRQLLCPRFNKAFLPKHAKVSPSSIVCFEILGLTNLGRFWFDKVLSCMISFSTISFFFSFCEISLKFSYNVLYIFFWVWRIFIRKSFIVSANRPCSPSSSFLFLNLCILLYYFLFCSSVSLPKGTLILALNWENFKIFIGSNSKLKSIDFGLL